MEKRFHLSAPLIACVVLVALFVLLAVLTYGKIKISQTDKGLATATTQVLVGVDPIAYLVERIGGDYVSVSVLTPPGKDPETFAPSPSSLASFVESKLFFVVGLPIEERFGKNLQLIAPNASTVDLSDSLETLRAPRHTHNDAHKESDGDARELDAQELDPHLWTSPANARVMVETIVDELSKNDPKHTEFFEANAKKLDGELGALQEEIGARLASVKGRSFYTFHPAYGYFAREFGLTQEAIESEGKTPRARELNDLIESGKESSARVLIVQPEFDRASAQVVAYAIGASLVVHSPLIKDYFENLRALTDAIARSFE